MKGHAHNHEIAKNTLLSFKNCLLYNHQTNFKQIGHNAFLDGREIKFLHMKDHLILKMEIMTIFLFI